MAGSLFQKHPFHPQAQQVLAQSTRAQPALWCRSTEQSFLRLASTPALHSVYGAQGMTNRDALAALDALQALPQVALRDEPAGVFALWRTLAGLGTASTKVWMDAYLAAFAIAGRLRLITLDRDFKSYVPHGLDLTLLNP